MEFSSQSWLRFSLNLPEPDQIGDLQKIQDFKTLSSEVRSHFKIKNTIGDGGSTAL